MISHKILPTHDGYNTYIASNTASKITCQYILDDIDISNNQEYENEIKKTLIDSIAYELYKNNYVNFSKNNKLKTQETIIKAEINVVPLGKKFGLIENDMFIVNGEKFTEEDLIEAVKIAYPERFI